MTCKGDASSCKRVSGGRKQVVNLQFLQKFIKAKGLKMIDIARKLELNSAQPLYYCFKEDDMKLSMIYKIFDVYGYDVTFSLGEQQEFIHVDMVLEDNTEEYGGVKLERLAFLKQGLENENVNVTKLCEAMDMAKSTIYYWYNHDDCNLSQIVKVSEITKIPLNIKIRPKTTGLVAGFKK